MKKIVYFFLSLLFSVQINQAQILLDPMTANSPAELEQILKNNDLIKKASLAQRAATLNAPPRLELKNGVIRELVGISPTGMPIYVQTNNNLDAAKTLSTNKVWPSGTLGLSLSGLGMTNRMAVWDGGGVRTTHQEFQSRATQTDGSPSLSDHATHVACTMMGGGVVANAKGMSYQAPIKCYDWNSDASEMSSAASAGLLVSNHSYSQISGWNYNDAQGYWEFWGDPSVSLVEDYKFGFYDNISQQWDQIMVNYPNYLPFVAAGNDRGSPGTIPSTFYIRNLSGDWVKGNSSNPPAAVGPYNSISGGPSNAKNVLTVGAVNKIVSGWTKSSDVVMSSFSGWGPTDDGRIKPDVVANGVAVYSAVATSNTAYSTYNGTSMATPNASGSALLIQQHYNNIKGSFMRAATLKGLIIHTADEAGSSVGPDYTFGWGLMNTAKAVLTISDTSKSMIVQNSLSTSSTYTYTFFSDGLSPIRATISWTDRPGSAPSPSLNPSTKMLVNDLDIRVKRNSDNTVFMPYVLNKANPSAAATTGDNSIDNVEQVYLATPSAGTYTITITGKGSMIGGAQPYSLIVSGITPKPSAAFTTVNKIVCSAKPVIFTDQSSGATNRMWYFPGGSPATSTALNPTVSYQYPGVYPVALRISSSTGYDSIYQDDYITVGGIPLPINETFESNSLTRNLWTVENPNNDTTWRLWTIGGTSPGNTAYGINNYDYPTAGVFDRLLSPVLDLRGYQSAQLDFQHAYTRYDNSGSDSLIIWISTNCGNSYTRVAAYGENGTGNFATAPNNTYASTNRFNPSTSADWCNGTLSPTCYSLSLTPYIGFHNVKIRFEQKSAGGNNMFLDNINITGTSLSPVANFYSLTKTVCVGDEIQLLDSSKFSPNQWKWYVNDADTIIYTVRNPKVKFLTPGVKTISLVVSNSTGTDSIAKINYINVLPSPNIPAITSTRGSVLCDGDSTIISTDVSNNFIWYKNNLPFSTSITSFQAKEEALYFIRVMGTNGCYSKSELLDLKTGVTPPKPTITKDLTNFSFCEGGSFNLTSSSLIDNQWFANDTLFQGKITRVFNFNQAGSFKVQVSDKGCVSFSDPIILTMSPRPNTSAIMGSSWAIKGDTASFYVNPGMVGSTFNWTLTGGSVQSGATTSAVVIKFNSTTSSTLNVQENASNNCKGLLQTLNISLVNTGLPNLKNNIEIKVYPNPAQNTIWVQTETRKASKMTIEVYSILGQRVYSNDEEISSGKSQKEIDIRNYPSGMYIIQILSDGKQFTKNFIKE